jgi:DNA recombination protein RmuC
LGDLKKHLNVIDQAQKNIVELSQQVVGLQDLLANKQSRGAFGEHQLTDLVKNILPPSAYKIQATMSNGKRADCLILLPNPPGDIAVDAKFPLEGYRALRNAKSDQEKKDASRQFRTDLQKHIQDISEKYILPGETAESALMFLPAEAVYAEIHANFPEIVDASYRAHVWIVSPTTLMATLTTVRAILKDARMAEQTQVIQKEIHTLLKDVIRLDDRVGNLRRHFTHAESDIKEIQTSSEKISRRGERIEDMQIEDVDVAAVEQVTGAAPLPSTDETPTLPLEPLN